MGWFDDSDSDEEEANQKPLDLLNDNALNNKSLVVGDDGEEEEDPLDAYMKGLTKAASDTKNNENNTEKKNYCGGRLDIENEEEATDHWTERKEETEINESNNNNNSSNLTTTSSLLAKQALESSFCRAGASKEKQASIAATAVAAGVTGGEGGGGGRGDYDQPYNNNSGSIVATTTKSGGGNVDIQLEPVKHEEMNYGDFSKAFWTPTDSSEGHAWRKQHEITCIPGTIDPIFHFAELRDIFGSDMIDWISKNGYARPTIVQSQALPAALSGNDTLITASTGSGKTLAYIWPLVVHVCDQPHLANDETGPIGLVLVPTRELAVQVQTYAKNMLKPFGGKSVTVTGGMGGYQLAKELTKLGGVEIVVATPGRLLDVLSVKKKGGLSLRRVTMVVLDEADRMLHMGFSSQVTQILQNIRPDRQTLMLSATMGRRIEKIATQWLQSSYVRISVGRTGEASQNVQQHVMVFPALAGKIQFMQEMLPVFQEVGRTLIFVATKDGCEDLLQLVQQKHPTLPVNTLHGDKHQSDRNASLRAFAKGDISVLIATDVAARGLDIPQVVTVVNFDPAKNLDAHVHRIGRAGRLSKEEDKQQTGTAYTLLLPKNADFAHVLMNAFEREGRQVSPQLVELAQKSRRSGNVAARSKWNKAGLGSDERDSSHHHQQQGQNKYYSSNHGHPQHFEKPPPSSASSYYGPADASSIRHPPAKRSRWS